MSLAALARAAGVSVSSVQTAERGAPRQRVDIKERLSRALGWTSDSIEQLGAHGRDPEPLPAGQPNLAVDHFARLAAGLRCEHQRLLEELARWMSVLDARKP
jgi:transcriptional regulator with XRE-family HTH domain